MKNCFFTWHIGLCLMPVNFVKLIARQARGAAYRPPSQAQGPAQGPALQSSQAPPPPPQAPQTANGLRAPRHVQRKRPQAPQAYSPRTDPSPPGAFTANGPKPRPIHRKRPQAPQPHLPQTVPGTPRHIHCKRCQAPQAHSPQMVPSASRRNSLSPGLKGNTPRPVISEHAKNIRIYN